MQSKNNNTLEIKVSEIIGISDVFQSKKFEKADTGLLPVLGITGEIKTMIDILFEGVKNYSRPPTNQFITKVSERLFCNFSNAFMVSSLTIEIW